jgi:hypothetical protein
LNDPLNKQETQELIDENPHLGIIDRHAEGVSKAKLILITLCCIAIVASFVITKIEFGGVGDRITNIESPCLRYGPESRQCHESFQTAIDSITDYQLCELLAKRPDITEVDDVDCRRIAQEARQRAKQRRQEDERLAPNSGVGSTRAPSAGNQPGRNSSPPRDGNSQKGQPDRSPQNPGVDQPAPGPQQPGSPSTDLPAASQPQPGSAGNQSGGSAGQESTPAQESPLYIPPIVEVEVPAAPVQTCEPPVISVNCR